MLESLETRTLLSYTFTYGGVNGPQVVDESGGADSFTVANNGFGSLEWSTDGGATFSTRWGNAPADTLNASPAVSLTINLTGDDSAVIDGIGIASSQATSSASSVQAHLLVNAALGNLADSLTVNDSASNLGAGTYTFDGATGSLTGPLTDINITRGANPFGGGAEIDGSAAANTFDVVSTYASGVIGEPITIVGGSGDDAANIFETTAGATATVNLGDGSNTVLIGGNDLAASIGAPVFVTDPTSLNIDDTADTTHATATLDDLSGNGATPFEVTGLGNAPIEYGAGVTAVNIRGGTNGTGGVTYDINNTPSGTTTTIDGGPNANTFNLSNDGESGGLNSLAGPVVVNGGSSKGDVVTLNDSDANFNDNYVITDTTVSRPNFGGLTYDGIGTLGLFAENTLGTNGNNTIDIDSTADFVTTNVFGQGGVDTINVNTTGFLGVLNVTTGGDDGSTVNLVADNEPVNVTLNALGFVNIGSAGGDGTMQGILGAIDIVDQPDFYTLTFHDENDPDSHAWILNNNDVFNTSSVALNGGIATTTYRPGELNAQLTIDGGFGANHFGVNNTTSDLTINDAPVDTVLNTGVGDDAVNVFGTGSNTLDIHGQGGDDSVTLGFETLVGMRDLNGTINVDNAGGLTSLILDDSEDKAGENASLTNEGTTGTVTGLSPATINYTDTGIKSLTVDGASGGNTFTINGTLPSATTTVNAGTGDNTVNVTGPGVADGTTLFISGGPSTNTLNYDAGGQVPTITSGPLHGEVLTTIPGAGTVNAIDDQQINITNAGPLAITPGPALTINGVAGYPIADAIVGTFTLPITAIFPPPPVGFPANLFSATIDWGGDGMSGGTISGTSNPILYEITGTHTFMHEGTYTPVTNTVTFSGGTITPIVNSTPVSITYGQAGPTPEISGPAIVTQDKLTGAMTPNITAVEGMNTGTIVLATFTDSNPLATTSDVTASIPVGGWGDGTPRVPVPLVLQQVGVTPSTSPTPGQPIFVILGSHTYAKETSTSLLLPLTLTIDVTAPGGVSNTLSSPFGDGVTVLDAPLFGQNGNTISGTAGISTGIVTIGTFLDANTDATSDDFTSGGGSTDVFWGDGSSTAMTAANFTATGSTNGVVFSINAAHTYAAQGQYTITVVVTDDGGQTTSGSSTATIATLQHTVLPTVSIKDGRVPPTAGVDRAVARSTRTRTTRKVTTTHTSKPAITVSHTVQKTRVHDAALQAISTEAKSRRPHH